MAEANDGVQQTPPPVPEYELSSYEPVEFTMPRMRVSDDMVTRKMLETAEQIGADYAPTKRKVVGPKENVEIDIIVFDENGEELKPLTSEKRLYTIGEGLMPIGFDRGILGMKVGETREFEFEAPDFTEDFEQVMKPFTAKVTVLTIMKKVVPEITDEWVKTYAPMYETADKFRMLVRNGLEQGMESATEEEKLNRAAGALAERFDGKIDDFWYESTRADLMRTYEAQAKQQGMDLEDWMGQQGMDKQQFSMMMMMQVRSMLVASFSLDAWARHYGIEPKEEDLKEVCQLMYQDRGMEIYNKIVEDNDEVQMEGLRVAARRSLANKDLVARSKITFFDPEEGDPALQQAE